MEKKPPLESSISKKIVTNCRSIRHCWADKVPSGFMQAGKPDITGCFHGLRFDFEVKRKASQKPTKLQEFNLWLWSAAGGITATVFSWEQVLQILAAVGPVELRTPEEMKEIKNRIPNKGE